MPVVGLVRVDPEEWPKIKDTLLSKGYKWHRDGDKHSQHGLWTPDIKTCVSGRDQETGYYWLDIRVLEDLGVKEQVQC